MEFEDKVIAVLDDHRGQLMALQSFTISLFRAMPIDAQARALAEWDTETEIARATFLSSSAPDQVLEAYDRYVARLNSLRVFPPAA